MRFDDRPFVNATPATLRGRETLGAAGEKVRPTSHYAQTERPGSPLAPFDPRVSKFYGASPTPPPPPTPGSPPTPLRTRCVRRACGLVGDSEGDADIPAAREPARNGTGKERPVGKRWKSRRASRDRPPPGRVWYYVFGHPTGRSFIHAVNGCPPAAAADGHALF